MSSPLIQPDELAAMIASVRPPVLADVRWTLGGPPGRGAYEAGHLPGAHCVDLEPSCPARPERAVGTRCRTGRSSSGRCGGSAYAPTPW